MTTIFKKYSEDDNIIVGEIEGGISGGIIFQGNIAVSSDFPTTEAVDNGHQYYIEENVTDDDATKTNTGLSFTKGQYITWNGNVWKTSQATVNWGSIGGSLVNQVDLKSELDSKMTDLGGFDTDDLSEGANNKYLTGNEFNKVSDDSDDITEGATNKFYPSSASTKLAGIEVGAEVNNISDTDALDLTDGGTTTLHNHNDTYYTETEVNNLLTPKFDKTTDNSDDITQGTTKLFMTSSEKSKLGTLENYFKGYFIDVDSLNADYPIGNSGEYALVGGGSGDTFYYWSESTSEWVDTGNTSTGDMLKGIYDPTNVNDDVFDMDNMSEGTTNKILTANERTAISDNTTNVALKANKTDVLEKDNTDIYVPSTDYHPATKKYVDENGGMSPATYDPTNKNADAFDMDNMAEGVDAKILTAAERADIGTATSDISTLQTNKADKSNVLELDNTNEFIPNNKFEPATKKYVDDNILSGGMSAVTYDPDSIQSDAFDSANTKYDNTIKGDLTSTNIQGAIDELTDGYDRIDLTPADSPYTATSIRKKVFAVDTMSGDVVINLPASTVDNEGDECFIYIEKDGGTLTVNTNGIDTLRGETTKVFNTKYDGMHIVSHQYGEPHWDVLGWMIDSRTDEIKYIPGTPGVSIDTLQDLLNYELSSGEITGGAITDNSDGTIGVSTSEWKLRNANDDSADIRVYTIPASASLAVAEGTRYLAVDYNAGTPEYTIVNDISNISYNDVSVKAILHRRGSKIDVLDIGKIANNFAAKYAKRESIVNWLQYGEGLQISTTGREFNVSAGSIYQGVARKEIPTLTSGTDNFEYYYRDGLGDWTVTAGNTQINNLNFDNGTGLLATLNNNHYGVHFVYTLVDNPSRLAVVYGTASYNTLSQAQAAGIPAVLPPFAEKYSLGKFIGKLIIEKNATTIADIQTPFEEVLTSSTPVNHNNLAGLQGGTVGEYNHLTNGELTVLQNTSGTNTGDQDLSGYQLTSEKGEANGYASLGADGKVPNAQIPDIAISQYLGNFVDLTTALADAGVQDGHRGDWFTTDDDTTYIVINDSPTLTTDVQVLKTPAGAVSSVNSQTGVVELDADDIDDTNTANKFVTSTDLTNLVTLTDGGDASLLHTHDGGGGGGGGEVTSQIVQVGTGELGAPEYELCDGRAIDGGIYPLLDAILGASGLGDFFKLHDITGATTGSGRGASVSPDGVYFAVSHNNDPYITIYKRDGDTFVKIADPDIKPTGTGWGVSFSPDGVHLSVAHATTPFVTIYKRDGDTFTKLANPETLPTGTGNGTAFSPDSTYLSVVHATTPFLTIYKRDGDVFTKLDNPETPPASTSYGTDFSADNTYLVVGHGGSPYITIYKRDGDVFTKLPNPDILPPQIVRGPAFSPNGDYLSAAHNNPPHLTIYKRDGDAFTKLADPDVDPTGTGYSSAFSPDNTYLSVGHQNSPFITNYVRNGDTFTKLEDPEELPAGTGEGISFTPNGEYQLVANVGAPGETIYKQTLGATLPDLPGDDNRLSNYIKTGA